MQSVSTIILAGGRGTRMKSERPKVLHTINRKPMLVHTLEKLNALGVGQILVVIGFKGDQIRNAVGERWNYVQQTEQLGTGHAVSVALPKLPKDCKTVFVVYGDDSAMTKPETLRQIIQKHLNSKNKMTIVTSIQPGVEVSGRVIRDKSGKLIDIKANSKLTPEELENNHEIVCGYFLFDRIWLDYELSKVEKSASGEYNLTALIYKALSLGSLQDIKLQDSNEWKSINTQRELRIARRLWKSFYGRQ